MRLTINNMCRRFSLGVLVLSLALVSCRKAKEKGEPIPFKPYSVADSSKIKTYPDGLRLYVVKQGPGDYPQNGENVRMHYYGVLDNGTVFDDSYSRGEPLTFSMGSGKVIAGIESAAQKLRFGTQAIAYVPASLGYGDGGADQKLPPKIPANSALTFHIDMVGSF